MNSAIDGIIIHRIPLAKDFTVSILFVSMYSHINDRTETIGIEAMIPPIKVLFFAISDTSTIMLDDIMNFIIICNIF